MMTVHEVSARSGVSVRTLHHYDAIGLFKPSFVSDAGYRYYDEAALTRLQSILLYRELRFPLREILRILDSPAYDARAALSQQIRLLELQRERLDAILAHAREIERTGVNRMTFSAFDKKKIDEYTREAKARWGSTEAYRAYEQQSAAQSEQQREDANEGLMQVFARFGAIRTLSPAAPEAQALVKALQDFISGNFYPCTDVILASLGRMYANDERFRAGIDERGGEGTAAFVSAAIEACCAG